MLEALLAPGDYVLELFYFDQVWLPKSLASRLSLVSLHEHIAACLFNTDDPIAGRLTGGRRRMPPACSSARDLWRKLRSFPPRPLPTTRWSLPTTVRSRPCRPPFELARHSLSRPTPAPTTIPAPTDATLPLKLVRFDCANRRGVFFFFSYCFLDFLRPLAFCLFLYSSFLSFVLVLVFVLDTCMQTRRRLRGSMCGTTLPRRR